MLFRAFYAEKIDLGAEPQHQVIVGERGDFLELYLALGQVDPRYGVCMQSQVSAARERHRAADDQPLRSRSGQ